ncbi:MAG: hypothetical protein RL033_4885 [Pseudomonadota bacterium]
MFKETHPILGTRDILPAIEFYARRLGSAIRPGARASLRCMIWIGTR